MSEKLNNLVFVSGPQGSGKSTLIRHLVTEIPCAFSPELKTRTPQFYWGGDEDVIPVNSFHRQALKYAQRATENYEYFVAAKKHQDKLVIGDRCIHDARAYRTAGIRLGWLTKEQDAEIENKLRILNLEELVNPFCIVLNPGFEVCKDHLTKRWAETGWIKFMETDMEYLMTVCDCFQAFKGADNIFYIEEKVDYSEGKCLKDLKEWITSLQH